MPCAYLPLVKWSPCAILCPVRVSCLGLACVAAVATPGLFLLPSLFLLPLLPGIPHQCHPGGDSWQTLHVSGLKTFPGISVCCTCSDRPWECVSAWSCRARQVDLSQILGRAAGLQCSLPGLSSPLSLLPAWREKPQSAARGQGLLLPPRCPPRVNLDYPLQQLVWEERMLV